MCVNVEFPLYFCFEFFSLVFSCVFSDVRLVRVDVHCVSVNSWIDWNLHRGGSPRKRSVPVAFYRILFFPLVSCSPRIVGV